MKRPVLVTIIGVFAILSGIAQVGFGALLVGLRSNAKFLADSKMTTDKITYIGIACLAVGTLAVLFAIGLLKGSRLSRNLIGLMELSGVALGIYSVVALDATRRASAFGTIAGALIVLYFLFGTDKARAFFAKDRPHAV